MKKRLLTTGYKYTPARFVLCRTLPLFSVAAFTCYTPYFKLVLE